MIYVKDRDISAGVTAASALWGLALILLVVRWFDDDSRVGVTAVFMMGVAATATVRSYFVTFSSMVRQAYRLDQRDVTPLR